ncbi:DedA family protein [Desulfovibrio inopinatus]|uniref:DedA family protein n=1 Tax=Desulfovibrio inopinatus TaxID=102109 RepID=UPI00040987E1|nr:DedA family protein [Desulfovibrio inopinatus]
MFPSLEYVIQTYGYAALFLGTFLEGETILLVAGFLAQSPVYGLDLHLVIATAFCGSLCGDQFAFYIGRFKGKQFINKREKWKARVGTVHRMLSRYHEILILSFRFFYGLRNLTPFILGTTDISGKKFFLLNAIGALVWAIIFGYCGFFFGKVVQEVLHDVHNAELIILGIVIGVLLLFWLRKVWRKKK